MKAKLVMVDDEYTFLLEDGTIIESDKIGWVNVGSFGFEILERFTKEDAKFIIDQDIDCDIKMMDEFSDPQEYIGVPLFEGEQKPKLHKGKVIIRLL
jgi:hypothetical protein